jgi:hypothetical protein
MLVLPNGVAQMKQVRWTAVKNTERTAIKRSGDTWYKQSVMGDLVLISEAIRPLHAGGDMRWINKNQIIEEIG